MKALKFAKKKKVSKTLQTRKLDILFSKIIRSIKFCEAEGKMINGKFVKCGGPLTNAHIENRANRRLRWDMHNCLSLCLGHHFFFHRNPLKFVEFLMMYYKEKYDYVLAHRNELNDEMYEETLERLQKASKSL